MLTLLAAGLSNAEIGKRLYLSNATVKTHINRIFAKTGARDRAQAVRYALPARPGDPGSVTALSPATIRHFTRPYLRERSTDGVTWPLG